MAEARASFLKPIIHHLVTGTTAGAPRKPERSRAAVAGGMVGLLPIQGLRVEQQMSGRVRRQKTGVRPEAYKGG